MQADVPRVKKGKYDADFHTIVEQNNGIEHRNPPGKFSYFNKFKGDQINGHGRGFPTSIFVNF